MAAPAVPFALYPGRATERPIGFHQEIKDIKIFNKAISGTETKFDLKSENLTVFLGKVNERARIYNWDTILQVPTVGPPAANVHIIEHYGMVKLAECRAHALTYFAAPRKECSRIPSCSFSS